MADIASNSASTHDVAEADAEERGGLVGRQVEERGRRRGLAEAPQGRDQVGERAGAVGGGPEGDGPGGRGRAASQSSGSISGGLSGHGVDVAGGRLLVVVGRADARRGGRAESGGGVPQGGVAVEEGGHVVVAEVEGVVGRQAVGTQQDQLAGAHVDRLAGPAGKTRASPRRFADSPSRRACV